MAEGPLPWPGGVSALPPFASAANRNLADDIDAKKQQLDALRARAADQAARDTRMAAYAERVKAENAEARRLVDVRRRGIETEVDRQRDADAEGRRLARDMAQFSTGLRTAEVQIEDLKKRIDARRAQSQALDAATEAAREQLDEALDLHHIREEQERIWTEKQRKIPNELAAKIRELESVEAEISALQGKCQDEESTVHSLRNSLSVLSARLANMQSQKSVLVGQWQANLSALSTIDSLIHSSESRVEETESLLRAREIEVSKAVERLQRELAALEKIERPRVSQKERELTDLKIKLSTVLRLVANQNSELGILTTAMQKGDRSLAQLRDLNSSRRRALNELENHVIPSLEHKVSILQTEIEESEENRLEEERVIDGLEDLVAAEESRLRELEEDLARVKDEQRSKASETEKLKQTERTLLSETKGTESAIQNLEKHISETSREIEAQETAAYSHEFASVELRREIKRLRGLDALQADLGRMKEEIGELGATLQDETERLSRIRDECEGVSAQVSKQQVQLEDADAELQRSEFHARDLEMDVGQMDRQLVVRSREREDLLVELALLKIQLKRLEERRARGETDLGTFEERIASAQAGFEERKAGLENEIAELRGTAVRAEEARSEAQRLVALERVGLEKLRKRWELLAHKLESLRELAHAEARGQQVKTPNHPSAEDLSAESERIQQMLADQVVRQREEMLAAQEKLREETAQIEEQIERLRVTLADTRSSTATWRQQTEMKGVPMGLIEERESLEAQLRDSVAFIEERRAQLVNIGRELEELQGAVEDAEHRKMNLDGELTMRRADIFKLDREVQDGNAKLGRARAQVGRLNPEATSQLGLKLLKEAKKELGERIIKLVSERGDGLDNQSLRDELRRIGIGNSEAKPKQMNRGGTNSRLASNPRMVPPAPAVRFPSDVDLLARSASEDGIPMHKSPAARPLPPSLKGSRTATPVRTKLGPGKAPTSTEGLALSGNSIAGSRKNLEKEM